MRSGTIELMSEFANILAFCKSLLDDLDDTKPNMHLWLAVSALQSYASEALETEGHSSSHLPLIQFIMEQLKLIQVPKNGRRYSTAVITTSFLWHLTSTSLYKKLKDFFILPSVCTLRKLSSAAIFESGKLDMQYLKVCTAGLNDRERIVTLMINEVYTAQRIEYSNGSFIGLTEDGGAAKTVLAFMVQSTCSKYKDVVCLIPVNRLDTGLQRMWFNKVMQALHKFFVVVAVSVDNHVCNRYVQYR